MKTRAPVFEVALGHSQDDLKGPLSGSVLVGGTGRFRRL